MPKGVARSGAGAAKAGSNSGKQPSYIKGNRGAKASQSRQYNGNQPRQGRNGKSYQHKTTRKAKLNVKSKPSGPTIKEVVEKAVKKTVTTKKVAKTTPAASKAPGAIVRSSRDALKSSATSRFTGPHIRSVMTFMAMGATATAAIKDKDGAALTEYNDVMQYVLKDKFFLPNEKGFSLRSSPTISNFIINPTGCYDVKMDRISRMIGLNSQLQKPNNVYRIEASFPVAKVATGSNAYPPYAISTKSLADGKKIVPNPSGLKSLGLESSVRRKVNPDKFTQGIVVDISGPKVVTDYINRKFDLLSLHASLNKLSAIGIGDIKTNPNNIMQHKEMGEYVFPDLDTYYRPNINTLKYQVELYTGCFYRASDYNQDFMSRSLLILRDLIISMKDMIDSPQWQQAKEQKLEIFAHDQWEMRDHVEGFAEVEKYVNDISKKISKISSAATEIMMLEKGKDNKAEVKKIADQIKRDMEPFQRVAAVDNEGYSYSRLKDIELNYCVVEGFHVEDDIRAGKEGSEIIYATIRDLNHGFSRQYRHIIDQVHPSSTEADIPLRFTGFRRSIAVVPITILPKYIQDSVLRLQDLTKEQKSAISGGKVASTQEPEIAADQSVAIANDDSCTATRGGKPSSMLATEDVAYITKDPDGKIIRG